MEKKRRKVELDIEAGIVILLVALGHLVPFDGAIFKIIFSFHMPFFFIKSGYCTKIKQNEEKFGRFVVRQVKNLLLPSWCCNIILIITKVVSVSDIKDTIYYIFVSPSHEWFLVALFWSKIVLFVFLKLGQKMQKTYQSALIAFCIGISFVLASLVVNNNLQNSPYIPFLLGSVLIAIAFVMIGHFIHRIDVKETIININIFDTKYKRMILLVMVCIIIPLTVSNTYVNIANAYWGRSDIYFVFTALFWCLVLLKLSQYILSRHSVLTKFLKFCGINSLYIYLIHSISYQIFSKIIYHYTGSYYTPMLDLPVYLSVCYFILAIAIALSICYIKDTIIKKVRYR